MLRRVLALAAATLVLGSAPAPALAQGNPFDNPLPPVAPTPTPTPTPTDDGSDDATGRNTLYAIGGALMLSFVGIGWWISRDARRALPPERRDDPRLREEGPHRKARQAKAKARAKGRAQREARRRARRAR